MIPVSVYIVSDSTGETAEAMAHAVLSQFPELQAEVRRFMKVETEQQVRGIFQKGLPQEPVLVFHSIVMERQRQALNEECARRSIPVVDLFSEPLAVVEKLTGEKPERKPGLIRELDVAYFEKISGIEFAVRYDDGRDPRGLLLADIVLLGVSRTSKTPLSMLLATKGFKVANLPLVPEFSLPPELDRVDPRRIVGLIISPGRLNEIRRERLRLLGLAADSSYAEDGRIDKELVYAKEVFDRLGCPVINVSDSTIEQTAAQIISGLRKELGEEIRRSTSE